ncbi:MAG: efflux RND transporter periplasmic adaptor subunit [Xanthomonadales bacterium]|nr:efflux RND transporter periplasmic adaptor subunit [Xanthomonadales bacterium]
MNAKVIAPIGVLLAALALVALLIGTASTVEPSLPQPLPTTVRVLTVQPERVQLKVHAQGTVVPRSESALVPEVSGRVDWVSPNLVPGGYFELDETLLRINQSDYIAAVERAEAALARADAENELAQFDYGRVQDLHGRSLVSQADLESARRGARVAAAALQDARLVLETARRDLARTELKAPFAGLVRSEKVDRGQFISRGAAVAEIYAVDFVEVRLPIADRQLAYLNLPENRRGELPVDLSPQISFRTDFAGQSQSWNGRLVRTEAEIDPGSRMVYAIGRISADPESQLLPPPVGLFVEAEIAGVAREDVVVLPRVALREGTRVLVVNDEERLSIRDVEILRVYRDEVYVTAGLNAGERVVVSPLQTVVDGMRVKPVATADRGQAG